MRDFPYLQGTLKLGEHQLFVVSLIQFGQDEGLFYQFLAVCPLSARHINYSGVAQLGGKVLLDKDLGNDYEQGDPRKCKDVPLPDPLKGGGIQGGLVFLLCHVPQSI
jgi:hypothetical protein